MLDFDGVRRLLPQTYPFVFIDRVLALDPFRSIECLKSVSGNEPHFVGHFPAMAIMPGCLIMEAVAQASILLFTLSAMECGRRDSAPLVEPAPGDSPDDRDGDAPMGAAEGEIFLVSSSRSRFLRPVVPGDALHIEVEVQKLVSRGAIVKGWGRVEGATVVTASMTFARAPRSALRAALEGAGELPA